MKLFACSFAVTCTLAASISQAQPAPPEARAGIIGVDAMAVLPVGDYGDFATLAIGPIGRVEFPVGPGYVTGRFGVLFHLLNSEIDDTTFLMFPLYGGYRYPLGSGAAYLAGELGITFAYLRTSTSLGSGSDTDTELGLTLGGGLRKGQLDLRGGLFLPDLDDAVGIFGSVGCDFASL